MENIRNEEFCTILDVIINIIGKHEIRIFRMCNGTHDVKLVRSLCCIKSKINLGKITYLEQMWPQL